VADQPVVKVLTPKVGVTGGGLDLKDALLNGQEGDIEGAASAGWVGEVMTRA
jgi:hypothetical protein